MDPMTVMSDVNWTDFRFQLSEKMGMPVSKLNVAYKFTTDAQKKAPNRLSNALQLLEMLEAAKDGLERTAAAKAKGKAPSKVFKVEIVDLNAGKGVDAMKATGKSKKKVSTYYYNHAYFLM